MNKKYLYLLVIPVILGMLVFMPIFEICEKKEDVYTYDENGWYC